MSLHNVWSPLTQAEVVGTEAFKLPVTADDALRYPTYLLFHLFHFLILNYGLPGLEAQWPEPPLTHAFPNPSAVYTALSRADIGTLPTKKRLRCEEQYNAVNVVGSCHVHELKASWMTTGTGVKTHALAGFVGNKIYCAPNSPLQCVQCMHSVHIHLYNYKVQ